MRVNSINNTKQAAPAFGNLVIKNQKYFAQKGMNIINAISENKDILRFAKESKDDIVFEKVGFAFSDWKDFEVSIREKGIKGFFYRLFNGDIGYWGAHKFDSRGESFVKELNYDDLSNSIAKGKEAKLAAKQAKLAAKQAKLAEKQAKLDKKHAWNEETNQRLEKIRQLTNI